MLETTSVKFTLNAHPLPSSNSSDNLKEQASSKLLYVDSLKMTRTVDDDLGTDAEPDATGWALKIGHTDDSFTHMRECAPIEISVTGIKQDTYIAASHSQARAMFSDPIQVKLDEQGNLAEDPLANMDLDDMDVVLHRSPIGFIVDDEAKEAFMRENLARLSEAVKLMRSEGE